MKKREYGDDVKLERADTVKKRYPHGVPKGPSILEAYQSNKITKQQLIEVVKLLEINGHSKDSLATIPYSAVESLWGDTYATNL